MFREVMKNSHQCQWSEGVAMGCIYHGHKKYGFLRVYSEKLWTIRTMINRALTPQWLSAGLVVEMAVFHSFVSP